MPWDPVFHLNKRFSTTRSKVTPPSCQVTCSHRHPLIPLPSEGHQSLEPGEVVTPPRSTRGETPKLCSRPSWCPRDNSHEVHATPVKENSFKAENFDWLAFALLQICTNYIKLEGKIWNLDHLRICEKWSKSLRKSLEKLDPSIHFCAMHRHPLFFASQTATKYEAFRLQKQHFFSWWLMICVSHMKINERSFHDLPKTTKTQFQI